MDLSIALSHWGNGRGEFAQDFGSDLNLGQPHHPTRSTRLTAAFNNFGNDSSDEVREDGSREDDEDLSDEDDEEKSHEDRRQDSDENAEGYLDGNDDESSDEDDEEEPAEEDEEDPVEEDKEDSDEETHVGNYQPPRWVDAQWKKNDKEDRKPMSLLPPKMTTRDTDATPAPSPPEARPARTTGGRQVSSVTEVSQVDINDLDLQTLVQKEVKGFSSKTPRFFVAHEAPISIPENDADDDESRNTSLDVDGPPMSSIYEIFDEMAAKAVDVGLCHKIPSSKLRIFTMCSGTEAPLLAMQLMQQSLKRQGQHSIPFDHLASVEIEPFKQAFIQRNYNPRILFRDVTEFTNVDPKGDQPHTAYGGTTAEPKDVDILIAGTVCKDWSTLSKTRKAFGHAGKSYNTLTGLVGYANRRRPKIIILENVKTAPWWDIRDWLGSLGYEALAVWVDTKNFYLPQTRQRGYLVAFDTKKFTPDVFNVELALNNWAGFMQHFQQRATSPFTDFLVPEDDPYLHQAKLAPLAAKVKGEMAWDACRHRHAKCRIDRQCGMLRPMTKWQTNGSCLFPDFGWNLWAKRQRERIWDTLEIELLLHAGERTYDMNYKCRWLELSQNVDRASDKLQWGIVSCVTPTGLPYLTTRGGPVVGKELLSLQGIPIDDLDLNKEKPNQLQDLAGNAMSTPVVGAAIFSAIMAAQSAMVESRRCFFADDLRELKNQGEWRELTSTNDHTGDRNQLPALQLRELQKAMGTFKAKGQDVNADHFDNFLLKKLQKLAGKTMRLCECETIPGGKVGIFKICKSCGHTACSLCAGNPEHDYEDIDANIVKKRKEPAIFMARVWNALPTALRLCVTDSIVTDLDPQLREAALGACAGPVTLRHIKRSRSWKITYEGSHAVLEIHFVRKCNPGAASYDDFFGATSIDYYWLLFAKADSKLGGSHPLRELLIRPIARMKQCNTLLRGEWATPRYEPIELLIHPPAGDVRWTHAWEAKLGLQQESFRKLEVPTRQVVEVFSSPEGAAKLLASTLQGEYSLLPKCGGASRSLHVHHDQRSGRPMFLHLDPEQLKNASHDSFVFADTHDRLGYKETRLIHAKVCKSWRPNSRNTQSAPPTDSHTKADVVVWKPQRDTYLEPYAHQPQPKMWTPVSLEVFEAQAVKCKADPLSIMLLHIPLLEGELKEFHGYQYPVPLTEKDTALKRFAWVIKRATLNLPDLGRWLRLWAVDSTTKICVDCVPTAPTIEWDRVKKKIVAREKVKEAIDYERTLRGRPQPLTATMHCQADHAILDVRINLPTLYHRVVGKFLAKASALQDQIKVNWQLSLDDGYDIPPTFELKALQSNANDPHVHLPPRDGGFSRVLWPEQQQALAWMVSQEQEPCQWKEREQEEVFVPGLGLRLDVEASVEKPIFGGVLADEVGSGKTTTTFALIAQMLKDDTQFHKDSNFFDLKATLILVPKDLSKQWEDELIGCFGKWKKPDLKYLIIKTTADLMKKELHELEEQDIIIAPWNIFDENGYWMNLANLCGARNRPASAGRAFQQWLRKALNDCGDMVKHSGHSETSRVWKCPKAPKEHKYREFEAVKSNKKQSGKQPDKSGFRPLFHLFRFRRLIVDEYSYLKGFSFFGVLELRAVSKWMLSGTPPLASFDAVNTTAKLIGTRLSGEDEEQGCLSFVTNGQKLQNQQTKAEDFQSYQDRHSATWYRARYESADQFVQTFIRKNKHNRGEERITPVPHTEVCHLSTMEQITYLEVYQRLMSQGTIFNDTYSLEQLSEMSRQQRIGACISMSRGPEDALVSCCSDMRGSMQSCADILDDKKNDVAFTIGKLYGELKDIFHYAMVQTDAQDLKESNTHFLSYKLRVYNKDFGDETTAALVDMLMFLAHQAQPRPKPSTKALTKKEIRARTKEMKSLAEDLNTYTTQLVDEIRSLRFFRNVVRGLKGQEELNCAGCARGAALGKSNIIGTCGHVACDTCLGSEDRARDNPDSCVAPSCSATALPHHIIRASRFSTTSISTENETDSRSSAVVKKIEWISEDPNNKILIFVQLPRIAAALLDALDQSPVEYTDVTNLRPPKANKKKSRKKAPPGPKTTANTTPRPRAKTKTKLNGQVEAFKKGKGGQVCVLMLESADAAGW
jgi:site-specific DNA-cytosine methylase